MEIGKTFYAPDRKAWRRWLAKNHTAKREIWLVYYKQGSNKPRIPYNDAVEEALCYGWIDSIVKGIDKKKYVQRFSPRKPGARWSPMNIERLRRLLKQRKVTRAGLAAAESVLSKVTERRNNVRANNAIPPDILRSLKRDPVVWKNFCRFPSSYKRIRVGWIDGSRNRNRAFKTRLAYFLKMTAQNKRFGMVQ